MSDTVVRWAIVLGAALVVYALVTLLQRKFGGRSRQRSRHRAAGTTTAVHFPADDPLWRAHSERLEAEPEEKRAKRAERARRRQKSAAAWSAGAVAGGSTGTSSGCGGGSSCGGGGCGGGCGGG